MNKRLVCVIVLCMAFGILGSQVYGQAQVAAAPATAPSAQAVQLQFKFTKDELLRYSMNMSANFTLTGSLPSGTQMPVIPMSMDSIMRQRTKSIETDGDADIAVALESLDLEIMGNQMPFDSSKTPVMSMVMSPQGEIKKVEGLAQMAGGLGGTPFSGMGAMGGNLVFPTTPLKVGDHWTQDVPFPFGGTMKFDGQLTALDGKTATIEQDLTGSINMPVPTLNAGGSSTSSAELAIKTTTTFAVDKGHVIDSTGKGTLTMNIAIPGSQSPVAGTADLKFKMELLPPE